MTVGTKGCPRFCYASLVLKQLIFIYFSEEWVLLDQTYSFENRELLTITKNADMHLYSSVSWNSVHNFKVNGQVVLVLALGEHGNLMIFTYFSFTSPLKFFEYSSFNLARATSPFIGITFFCWIFLIQKWSIQKEKHTSFYNYWLLVNIKRRKMENWKKLKRAILENNLMSRNSHWRCSVKKLFLKILQYSLENTCVGVWFWWGCSNAGVFLWILRII